MGSLVRIRRKGQRKKNIDKATPYIPKEFLDKVKKLEEQLLKFQKALG